MTAKQYLGLIDEIDEYINEQLERKPEILTRATKVTQENDGMPHVPGISDKVGSCATDIAAIDETVKMMNAFKDEIKGQVKELINDDERKVLTRYYLDNVCMPDIAVEMHVSVAWVVKLKNRGEVHLKVLRSELFMRAKKLLKF